MSDSVDTNKGNPTTTGSEYEEQVQELLDRFQTEENVAALQRLLEQGGVPDGQRGAVWRYFLGCGAGSAGAAAAAALLQGAAASPVLPGELARLRADCAACALLSDAGSRLRDRPAEARARLERVVLCLRTRAGVGAYAPWMCATVAPFVCEGLGETECLACACALARCVAPQVFCQDAGTGADAITSAVDNGASQALAELLRLLVYYVDPALGLHLEQRGAGAAVAGAARGWLATLLATACAGLGAVRALWDAVLVARDARRPLALALALLVRRSPSLLAAPTDADLRTAIASEVRVTDATDARALLKEASALVPLIPRSAWKQARALARGSDPRRGGVPRAWVAAHVAGAVCLRVAFRDVLAEQRAGAPVFFVDGRPAADAARGALPTALALPLAAVLDDAHPARLRDALGALHALAAAAPPAHRFVLFGRGPQCANSEVDADAADLAAIAMTLLRSGLRHLAVVHNGFRSIHALALRGEVELVNHQRDTCPLCTPSASGTPSRTRTAIANTVSSLFSRASAAVRSSSIDAGIESLRVRAASAFHEPANGQKRATAPAHAPAHAPATPQPVVSTLQETDAPDVASSKKPETVASASSSSHPQHQVQTSPETSSVVVTPAGTNGGASADVQNAASETPESPATLSETPTTSPATEKLRTAPLADLPVASSSECVFTIEDDEDEDENDDA